MVAILRKYQPSELNVMKPNKQKTLLDLPLELLVMILNHVDNSDLLGMILMNKSIYNQFLPFIYSSFKIPNKQFDLSLMDKYAKYINEIEISSTSYNQEINLYLSKMIQQDKVYSIKCKDICFYSLINHPQRQQFKFKHIDFGKGTASMDLFYSHFSLLNQTQILNNLKTIHLEINDELNVQLFDLLPHSIQSIAINSSIEIDNGLLMTELTKLDFITNLSIELSEADSSEFQSLFEIGFPSLKYLKIICESNSNHSNSVNEIRIKSNGFPVLKSLILNIPNSSVIIEDQMNHLNELQIVKYSFNDLSFNPTLFPSLKSIQLNSKINFQTFYYYNLTLLNNNSSNLNLLKKLSLSSAIIDPYFIDFLTQRCTSLEELELIFCNSIVTKKYNLSIKKLIFKLNKDNFDFLINLLLSCTQLQYLTLYTGWNTFDQNSNQIRLQFPNLTLEHKRF
ncbi:hypothetical protein K502DRAFT_347719 [Neoconidiobolus thromboides FSU 785]|nr:hypothetical protein K502DRAFT_347719 [Neoconidiobolus thromboides FSU 785]